VTTLRLRRAQVEFRCDDPNLTPAAGLITVRELDRVAGIAARIDRAIGPLASPRARDRFYQASDVVLGFAAPSSPAATSCATAGMRVHGTTQCRPIEVFRAEEQPLLGPLTYGAFDTPTWSEPKVHRDFHVQVDKAIYSVHHHLIGRTLRARLDSTTLKLYLSGELMKVHPRIPPGRRRTDPADMPTGTEIYATRDTDRLQQLASQGGEAIGRYAAALLDTPLPWTKMRQVYRLLGLAKKWGPDRVEEACRRALDAEAIDVNLISRMIERALESTDPDSRPDPVIVQGRFARDPSEFSSHKEAGQ